MENRKIRYSKKALKENLNELLKEKRISEISVRELCEAADLNRSTFYAHYEDIYSLFNEYENDFIAQMPVMLNQADDLKASIRSLIIFTKENIHLVRAFTYDGHLNTKLNSDSLTLWNNESQKTEKQQSAFLLLSHFFTAGFFDSLVYWISEENELSLDEVTDMITETFEAVTKIRLRWQRPMTNYKD